MLQMITVNQALLNCYCYGCHIVETLLLPLFVAIVTVETLSEKEIYSRQLWLFGLFNWTIYFIVLLYLFVEDLSTTKLFI